MSISDHNLSVLVVVVLNVSYFNLFSRKTWPISTKFSTKHPLEKGMQICSNEGPGLFPRGKKNKRVIIYWQNLKQTSELQKVKNVPDD